MNHQYYAKGWDKDANFFTKAGVYARFAKNIKKESRII